MDINKLTLENIPLLESLLDAPLEPNIGSKEDPLGYDNYSFFEHCNLPIELKRKFDREAEYETFMIACVTEERSIEWLLKCYNLTDNPTNKLVFLKIIVDEYKHSLIYFNLVKILYPEKDPITEYKKYKEELTNKDFWKQFDGEDLNFLIFQHFTSESMFTADLKYQYKMSTNPLVKQSLKRVFADESNHVALGKQLQLHLSDENREKLRKNIVLKIKQILIYGMGMYNPHKYTIIMDSYKTNFLDLYEDMKKSQRAKNLTVSTAKALFKAARDLKLTDTIDFDEFMIDNNLMTKYKEFL